MTYTIDKALIPSLTFNAGGGDDSLLINHANGNPMPTGGVFYDGGAGTNDSLTINATAGTDTVTLANALTGPANSTTIGLNDRTTAADRRKRDLQQRRWHRHPGLGERADQHPHLQRRAHAGEWDELYLSGGSYNFGAGPGREHGQVEPHRQSRLGGHVRRQPASARLVMYDAGVTLRTNGSNFLRVSDVLELNGAAKIDLKDNDMILHANVGIWQGSSYNGATGLVGRGFSGGGWTGTDGIITSMTAATASRARTTLGVATAAAINGTDPLQTTTWNGETVSGNTAIVKYTYLGDFNLDGRVNGDDYFLIDTGFTAPTTGYFNGDFDYSGKIDADDYFWIDQNYSSQGPML